MVDLTVGRRMKKQRDARFRESWQEVRVWVPSKADAEKVQKLAADLRAKAQQFVGLTELIGVQKMSQATFSRTMEAIANQGSAAYTTESGAVLTLLSELAAEGHITDMSAAFIIFARAYPSNATFVEEGVPAKVLNHYLFRNQQIKGDAFLSWEKSNPDWASKMKERLREPKEFSILVSQMGEDIKRSGKKQH